MSNVSSSACQHFSSLVSNQHFFLRLGAENTRPHSTSLPMTLTTLSNHWYDYVATTAFDSGWSQWSQSQRTFFSVLVRRVYISPIRLQKKLL